jgi:hypothetical protein
VPFGYEEAIGYMHGSLRDKDGVAATVSPFITISQGMYLLCLRWFSQSSPLRYTARARL